MNTPIHTDRKCQEKINSITHHPLVHTQTTVDLRMVAATDQPRVSENTCHSRKSPDERQQPSSDRTVRADSVHELPRESLLPQGNIERHRKEATPGPSVWPSKEVSSFVAELRQQERLSRRIALYEKQSRLRRSSGQWPRKHLTVAHRKARLSILRISIRTCWRNAITAFRLSLYRFLGRFRS